jgi:hypothetical protein
MPISSSTVSEAWWIDSSSSADRSVIGANGRLGWRRGDCRIFAAPPLPLWRSPPRRRCGLVCYGSLMSPVPIGLALLSCHRDIARATPLV